MVYAQMASDQYSFRISRASKQKKL